VGHQVAGGEFAHLAGADDENILALQGSKDLFCQLHRNRGDGNRGRAHRSLAAYPFRHRERAGEEPIKLAADRAHGAGGGIGLLYLAKNLSFADHHRIQTRSHPEDMADGVLFT
jgi:hypothetical protein